jgi:hypothetical protein
LMLARLLSRRLFSACLFFALLFPAKLFVLISPKIVPWRCSVCLFHVSVFLTLLYQPHKFHHGCSLHS